MSWAPALMLVSIPVILLVIGLCIDDYLKAHPRCKRNAYLPAHDARCDRFPDWRVNAPGERR